MVAIATLTALAQAVLLAPVALLVRRVFDHSIPQGDGAELVLLGTAVLALYLASTALALVSRRIAIRMAKRAVARIRAELLTRIYALPRAWHDRQDPGALHSVLVYDGDRLEVLLTQIANSVIPALLVAVALGVVAVSVSPLLSAIVLLALLLFSFGARMLATRARGRAREWRRAHVAFSSGIRVALRAMPLAKAHGAEPWEIRRNSRRAEDLAEAAASFGGAQSGLVAAINAVAGTIGVIVLLFGGAEVIAGRMTTGDLISFYAVGALVIRQVAVASPGLTNAYAGAESVRHIEELADTRFDEPYAGTRTLEPRGRVALEDVTFGYGDDPVLVDIDLEVAPGEHVALLGPNGSGKSTLVSLLIGLYAPQDGRVLLDATPLDEIDVATLRARIGVVLQDPVLVPGTIAENIAYGRPETTARELAAAVRAAGADAFVDALPAGLETHVGDEGLRLSGGQRQQVAVARALLGEPSLIVLDEPTTYLDHAAIDDVLDQLEERPGDPTVILVTHDPVVAARADRIVRLRDGRIEGIEAGRGSASVGAA